MRASVVRHHNESVALGTTPAGEGGPTVLRMILGGRMRRLREACGISLENAGEAIRGSHSKISRLELGRTGFRERDLVDLLDLYGIIDEDERAEFKQLAKQANTSGWWHRDTDWLPKWFDTYLGLEQAAQLIRCYEPRVVPELLQTPDYARALMVLAHPNEDEESIERRVALRMRRQEILTRPDPPQLWLIVEEAALRRGIGGSQVWLAQLDHVLRATDKSNITVQVLADHVGGPALADGAFTMLRFAESDLPDIVYLQQLTGALYLDKGADLAAYRAVANLLSVHAAPPEYTSQLIAALRERHPPTLDQPSDI
ncbi:helix-turn-helix domain-containing protein [Nocardia sp. NBC_01730]|uniref:helix-turn-helix domain-containing protein n=1 Tax=Nocardia sp. NBC_01730 TaxID=2975998 RepID=UPI002E122098|nr:helix-turn-helix domain-containing protein [Nocardia sp. NBC_01730]